MSKIICEICGTSYPDTNMQCPICGCVKPVDANAAVNKETETSGTYAYVKGGRFSKKNVKKRNAGLVMPAEQNVQSDVEDKEAKTNRVLLYTIAALLLAVIAVGIYVAIYFFGDAKLPDADSTENTQISTTETITGETTETIAEETQDTMLSILCEEITITPETVKLENAGQVQQLAVTLTPVDTTDTVSYASSDPTVVTVDDAGKLTAVSAGKATITITCGTVQTACEVECKFTDETTDKPQTEFKLNRTDFTLSSKGESWLLYTGKIPVTEIVWSSENESVATVTNGKVVAVGGGTTSIHAEYDGKKYSCTVRCAFESTSESTASGSYTISSSDVTISVGESFYLTLKDSNGKNVEVTWSSDNSKAVTISGNKITGKTSGSTTVYATYNGTKYSCIVRVK